MKSDMEGDIPGCFTAYYNPKSLMNISSFKDVRKKFRVTLDTGKENAILVHVGDGKVMNSRRPITDLVKSIGRN